MFDPFEVDETRVHQPKISANDLAKFMVTAEVGREGIVKAAKYPKKPLVIRYRDARLAIKRAMCDIVNERRIINEARNELAGRVEEGTASDFSRDDAAQSIEALDAYLALRNQFVGFDFVQAPTSQPKLEISGVNVSVTCDVIIHNEVRGIPYMGAALLRMTKPDEDESDRASEKRNEMGKYAATLVYMQAKNLNLEDRKCKPDLCWSVDVRSRDIHKAPASIVRRIGNIEAACRTILDIWNRV